MAKGARSLVLKLLSRKYKSLEPSGISKVELATQTRFSLADVDEAVNDLESRGYIMSENDVYTFVRPESQRRE